jgi:SNF2 family DNA or RNA helicase
MKTKPMAHQAEALRLMNGRAYFGLFMEMGTGKTWTFLADAERLFGAGKIDAMVIVAPKGVHTNWITREIPAHLEVDHVAVAYRSGAGKRERQRMEQLFKPRDIGDPIKLRILAINIDALGYKSGMDFAMRFINSAAHVLTVVDESDTIKNSKAGRTKAVMRLGHHSAYRRIGTGTPSPNSPVDLFSQMQFLREGLLGTNSHSAFVAEYAHLLPETHRLVQHIKERSKARFTPQVVATDKNGAPMWRNLDKLKALLQPHTFRVLKKDCLDLPPKVYKNVVFELSDEQRAEYDRMENELRIDVGSETAAFTGSTLMKLQQITSGFVMLEGVPRILNSRANPRLDALRELLPLIDAQFIVWARFNEELRTIAAMLSEQGVSFVEYRGETSDKDRELAVDSFQAGQVTAFVGQPQSGGVGIPLFAATTVIYYSNDFNLRTRLQSEDRAHRKGTKSSVLYIDLVADNTVDVSIAKALQRKQSVSRQIHDDRGIAFGVDEGDNSALEKGLF